MRHAQQLIPAALLPALLALAAPAQGDERLVSRQYDADAVVRIDGRVGVQATIGFAEGELIENVAVGDSQAWQITPNKRADLLFVKPLEASARTNMTVVTDRRTYFFDLVAGARAKPVYMLRFTYPEEERLAAEKAREDRTLALTEAEQGILAGDLAAAPADPALLNFAWGRKGDAAILPLRIYDDGDATYLLWPEKRSVPAILIRNEKGEEGPVNYAVRGNAIVIDQVPALIVLRSGRAEATLTNLREPGRRQAAAPAAMAASLSSSPSSSSGAARPAAQR